MRRRDFITGIAGSAATWPLAARAQQEGGIKRIGVLIGTGESDPAVRPRLAALKQGLSELGWVEGRNLQIEYRWASGNPKQQEIMQQSWWH
jgi:putative ABC transport system substrate-binding protein